MRKERVMINLTRDTKELLDKEIIKSGERLSYEKFIKKLLKNKQNK